MKKVLFVASVASNLKMFNMLNTEILIKQGYKVHVATNFENGNACTKEVVEEYKSELESMGAEWFQIDFSRSISAIKQNVASYKALLKLVLENDYEFIHCHTPVASAICRMVSRKTGVKTIYTAHGFHFFRGAPLKYNLFLKSAERYLAHFTDLIITINKEDYEAAKKFKLRKNGRVLYIPGVGINTDIYEKKAIDEQTKRKELNIPANEKIVITVAELIVRKNYFVALEAFSAIKKSAHYIICGQGPLEDDLKAKAKELGIENRVHFLGYRTDIDELMKLADIFLFTTSQEGLPVAVMEAMRAGLPVIASEVRGNIDLVENEKGGYLCDKDDYYSFAKYIDKLLSDSELRKNMGEFNKQRIENFSADKIRRMMDENYKMAAKM